MGCSISDQLLTTSRTPFKFNPDRDASPKVIRVILGTPWIAITMMRHDISVGIFALVELLFVERDTDSGRSSRHVRTLELDRKLTLLLSDVTGLAAELKSYFRTSHSAMHSSVRKIPSSCQHFGTRSILQHSADTLCLVAGITRQSDYIFLTTKRWWQE
jgi:hypothetical protein